MAGLFDRKVPQPSAYKRVLGTMDLTGIGIAAIIGAGIFFLLGAEAQATGPAVLVALALGGVVATLAALSYAEASSILPGSGSAYGFAYAAFGRLPAFLTGWLFLNSYAIGNAGVAIGWSSYLASGLESLGMPLPAWMLAGPADGGVLNLPAALIALLVAWVVAQGVALGTRLNNALVVVKLAIVALVIVVGAFHVDGANWDPFLRTDASGLAASAAFLFFAYIGFDTIGAAGAEARNPRRQLPRAILVSMAVCTILYVLMAGVITGMDTPELEGREVIVAKFDAAGLAWVSWIITGGVLVGLATVVYAFHMAMARITQTMAGDGFAPTGLGRLSRSGSPARASWVIGAVTAVAAAVVPLKGVIDMGVVATVAIYVLVSIGILALRRQSTPAADAFRVPAAVHALAILTLVALVAIGIGPLIHMLFAAWVALALVLYGFWAHRSSVHADH